MVLVFRFFIILVLLTLSPLAAQAQGFAQMQGPQGQTGTSGSTGVSTPTLAPPAPSFGNQGARQAPAAGQAITAPAAAYPGGVYPGDGPQLPPLEPTEFQNFIAQSTGRLLPLYGYNLFTNVPSTFAAVENVPVTPDYVIGPGDQILIRIWGQVDGEYRLEVDRDGTVNIPRVGTISVSGIRMQDLQGYVRNAIARNFRNFELSVSLGQLRSIQIFVVGQARRPGSYTVSSLSTLVTALFASGGPSGTGSMRHIQLKRGDRMVSEFDVYDFLTKGDKSKDARLLPGDVIFIPPAGPVAALFGSAKGAPLY